MRSLLTLPFLLVSRRSCLAFTSGISSVSGAVPLQRYPPAGELGLVPQGTPCLHTLAAPPADAALGWALLGLSFSRAGPALCVGSGVVCEHMIPHLLAGG